MFKPWEEAQQDINAAKLAVAIIDLLVFKGHISRTEGNQIISDSIELAKENKPVTI